MLGKLFTRLIILLVVVLAVGTFRFNQVSDVEDPELLRQAKQVLTDRFRSKSLDELGRALKSRHSLDVVVARGRDLIAQSVDVHTVTASRALIPWGDNDIVVLQMDFVLKDAGAKVAAGRSYLRFEPTRDDRWRYLGETDFEGFYKNLLRLNK